jgi:integrase
VLCGEKKGKIPPSNFNFHALRHVYASLHIESGLPPKRVQYLMGHASISMTFDHYGKLFENPDLVREAMARVGAELGA